MFRLSILAMIVLPTAFGSVAISAEPPADRVIAMYFHRTERCPTCKMMGSYAEEAMKSGFAERLKKGTIEFRTIDFQKKENAEIAKAYKVTGPALIVANIEDNKVAEYKDLKDIWTKVRQKPEFIKYVQDNVKAYIE